jgi:hypothetical protein
MSVPSPLRDLFGKICDVYAACQYPRELVLRYFTGHFVQEANFPQSLSGFGRAICEIGLWDFGFVAMDPIVSSTSRTLPMVDDETMAKATVKARFGALSRNFRESGIAPVTDPFPMET